MLDKDIHSNSRMFHVTVCIHVHVCMYACIYLLGKQLVAILLFAIL